MRIPADSSIWHWEKNGRYSLRYAYRLLNEEKQKQTPECLNVKAHGLCKAMWYILSPSKMCKINRHDLVGQFCPQIYKIGI